LLQRDIEEDIETGVLTVIELSTEIDPHFQRVLGHCFGTVPVILLRTMDAIHLASALAAKEKRIVATDHRLREAAISLGLDVFP
jgi:hypothetical protein